MGINYDFYENPIPKGSNRRPRLHARVVPKTTVDSNDITAKLHDRSTLTSGDVQAVLTMLAEVLVEELKQGNIVHINGLGYFQLTLECPAVRTAKDIRAESIRIKSVVFRPDARLKKEIRRFRVNRVAIKNHSSRLTDSQIKTILTRHFQNHSHMTSHEFRIRCGFTRSTAARRLLQLVREGTLRKVGHHRSPLYEPGNIF